MHCDLVALDYEMPVMNAHIMLAKQHPYLNRINKAIDQNRLKLNQILEKYLSLVDKYDKCIEQKLIKPLSEFDLLFFLY